MVCFCIVMLVACTHAAIRVDIHKRMSEAMNSPIMKRAADLPTEEDILGLQIGEHLQVSSLDDDIVLF